MSRFLLHTAVCQQNLPPRKARNSGVAVTETLASRAAGSQIIYEPSNGKQHPVGAVFYITESADSDQIIGTGVAGEDLETGSMIINMTEGDDVLATADFTKMVIEGIQIDWTQPPPQNYYMRVVFVTGQHAEFNIETAIQDYQSLAFHDS